eukprot:7440867-Alexandrium_andersonii.AAC.1
MVPVMVALCNTYNSGSPRDMARLAAAVHLARFYEVLNSATHFLTDDEHDLVMAAVWGFNQSYTQLAMDASNRGRLQFNLVNKNHVLVHMALGAKFLNPTATWTYPYEDLMGRAKRVAMASKAGLVGHRLPGHIMLKYRQVLHFALESMQ